MLNLVYIALGSNLGDREQYIEKAIGYLNDHEDIEVTQFSDLIETKSDSSFSQPDYLNAVIECKTFRWKGHVDWRDDINVGVTRSMEEVQAWKERCPLNKMLDFYSDEEFLQKLESLENDLKNEMEKTLKESLMDRETPASFDELTSNTLPN